MGLRVLLVGWLMEDGLPSAHVPYVAGLGYGREANASQHIHCLPMAA